MKPREAYLKLLATTLKSIHLCFHAALRDLKFYYQVETEGAYLKATNLEKKIPFDCSIPAWFLAGTHQGCVYVKKWICFSISFFSNNLSLPSSFLVCFLLQPHIKTYFLPLPLPGTNFYPFFNIQTILQNFWKPGDLGPDPSSLKAIGVFLLTLAFEQTVGKYNMFYMPVK